jgi:hypothetical protein
VEDRRSNTIHNWINWLHRARLRLWTALSNGQINHPPDNMSSESDGGMILIGENRRSRRKTCPSSTLSTTNPTWIDTGANLGLRCERPAINGLSHGTAIHNGTLRYQSVYCRLVVVMGWDCRLRTTTLGLLYYPRVTAMWNWYMRSVRANS